MKRRLLALSMLVTAAEGLVFTSANVIAAHFYIAGLVFALSLLALAFQAFAFGKLNQAQVA